MAHVRTAEANGTKELPSITSLSVEGFKSIDAEQTIEIRPLTILAGANSSGKSSLMQPLLMLKQTLEATYDPGPLKIDGPNVAYTKVDQFLCSAAEGERYGRFVFGVSLANNSTMQFSFAKGTGVPIELLYIRFKDESEIYDVAIGEYEYSNFPVKHQFISELETRYIKEKAHIVTRENRFFMDCDVIFKQSNRTVFGFRLGGHEYEKVLTQVVHVPGSRGNPQRNYKITSLSDRFAGTFENYTASIIAKRQANPDSLERLGKDFLELGLTWKVEAKQIDDTQVELRVGRLPAPARGGAHDLVSIADVGFGVSQTLPVVVALLVAKPGQLVYIEQPEIHLHPRSQHAMAKVIARAAKRGVKVVIETHSSILLLGIQSLIALDELDPKIVILHWCQRDPKTGLTNVTSNEIDEAGSFGDWPEDFDDVSLEAQMRFLDAAEKKLAK